MRISTATATSQPPLAPTGPLPAAHGGSATISSVPTAKQTIAGRIAIANTRAAGCPPGVLRVEIHVGRAVAIQSTPIASGWAVENSANVADAASKMRTVALVSKKRFGATSRIAH